MHACHTLTLDQLLSLRDGDPADAQAKSHAERCSLCSREISRLRSVQSALHALPALVPPPYDGAALQERLQRIRAYRKTRIAAAAGICALAVALITSIYVVRPRDATEATSAPQETSVATASIDPMPEKLSLVIRSQELESRLRRLPRRPQIERASTSATIDALQSHIQWVDYQLSLSDDAGMTERQAAELWQNRIQLMDSLLKVRYAEAQRTAVALNDVSRGSL